MWFLFALLCTLGWGSADLFYKAGTDENDRYSHLKIAVWVGLVMGLAAFFLMPFAETPASFSSLIRHAVNYSPASLCYIISMVIGYAGLRYLELSVASPVQNASGAFSAVLMILYFSLTGRFTEIRDQLSWLDLTGVAIIVAGVILLAVEEQKTAQEGVSPDGTAKYTLGALALVFPLLYCLFDTLGTAADGIILSRPAESSMGEIDVLIIYGLTFMLFGLLAWLFLWIRQKKAYNPFSRTEWKKAVAASFEEIGQVFYVYAMARNPVVAAPMVGSYCAISALLSRLLLKEKLKNRQWLLVIAIILGILLLGISEGLAER